MGATVVCGMFAALIRHHDGGHTVLMAEKTYEKNTYPHRPRWSVVHVGDRARATHWIFNGAAACADGIVCGPGGSILPEIYIRRWESALNRPALIDGETATLEVMPASDIYGEKPIRSEVAAVLRDAGHWALACAVEQGRKVDYSPRALSAECLHAMGRAALGAWRLGIAFDPEARNEACDAPWAAGVSAPSPSPGTEGWCEALRFPLDPSIRGRDYAPCIARIGVGATWRLFNRASSALEEAIRQAATLEVACPRSGLKAIADARRALACTDTAPAATRFRLVPHDGDDWRSRALADAREAVSCHRAGIGDGNPVPEDGPLEVSMTEMMLLLDGRITTASGLRVYIPHDDVEVEMPPHATPSTRAFQAEFGFGEAA